MNASSALLEPWWQTSEEDRPIGGGREGQMGAWDMQRFADEQIRGLIRQVFLPGYPRAARQVVFSGAGSEIRTQSVCLRVAEALSAHGNADVCVLGDNLSPQSGRNDLGGTSIGGGATPEHAGAVRMSSRQISARVWFVLRPASASCAGLSVAALRSRLAELRRRFDYTIVHAPSVMHSSEASVWGRLTDGMVLVLEAHRTRRMTVQRIRESLRSADVRLLGAVLSERRFPIPERLYRRL